MRGVNDIPRHELCDICGGEVPAAEAQRVELTAASAMCPTPMVLHQDCYERASALWQPDPESYCVVDKEFPETQQWTQPQDAEA